MDDRIAEMLDAMSRQLDGQKEIKMDANVRLQCVQVAMQCELRIPTGDVLGTAQRILAFVLGNDVPGPVVVLNGPEASKHREKALEAMAQVRDRVATNQGMRLEIVEFRDDGGLLVEIKPLVARNPERLQVGEGHIRFA